MGRLSYYNPSIKFDRKALTEVWEILNRYEEKIADIPEKYMWIIEDNMDKDYIFVIDDMYNIDLRNDAKKIITYLYTNFLSTPEEKAVLKQLEKIQYKDKMAQEHINKKEIENLVFKNKNIELRINCEEENYREKSNLPVEYKKTLLKSIITKIKGFFRNIFGK